MMKYMHHTEHNGEKNPAATGPHHIRRAGVQRFPGENFLKLPTPSYPKILPGANLFYKKNIILSSKAFILHAFLY
jgi:hypothetical protein